MDTLQIKENCADKVSQNRKLQQFFKDKVYWGIKDIPLTRKVYRGKRNQNGKRKNEVYYVSSDQQYRISESMLVKYVEYILEEISKTKKVDVAGWDVNAKTDYFHILHRNALNNVKNDGEYKDFISHFLNQQSVQEYENVKLKRKIAEKNFKDIIEKIEVYETGILCIFTNGFEMSIQF